VKPVDGKEVVSKGNNTIQWYPGHMVKAKQMVTQHLPMVDVVVELLDARIPAASRNPDIAASLGSKPRLVVLNKADLADPRVTRAWQQQLQEEGSSALAVVATGKEGLAELPLRAAALAKPALERWRRKGRLPRAPRVMMVGIPNVGKSTLINRLAGTGRLTVADRPGVTRIQQWVKIRGDLDLLDMPGILMPRIGDTQVGMKLAATGAISDAVFDLQEVAYALLSWLLEPYPDLIRQRYGLTDLGDPLSCLHSIGIKRGALRTGGEVDLLRTAEHLLDEFRGGRIGRISLEYPTSTNVVG